VWDAASGRPLAILAGHIDRGFQAAFSPNGKRTVTASADGTAMGYIADFNELLMWAKQRLPIDPGK